jgi:6-phosphogluconolactonase
MFNSLKTLEGALFFITTLATLTLHAAAASNYLVYVGTYTDKGSKGIYAYRFDPANRKLAPIGLVAETPNPSFIAADPSGKFLYAVNEQQTWEGAKTGGVTAFSIDRVSGKLTSLNQLSSLGTDPAHLSFDRTGKYVLVANYSSGSIAVFPVQPDGKLAPHTALLQQAGASINKERQEGPHAHYISASFDNRFVLTADLGADKVFVYRFNPKDGTLAPNSPPSISVKPGSGPRHLAFAPSGKYVYLAEELTGTVTVFAFDTNTGTLATKQTISALPKDFHGDNTEAEIVVDASGKHLYVSNRGDQSNEIDVFDISSTDGTLSFVQRISSGGKAPRNFAIDPTGKWLFAANQESDNIQLFRIDPNTGQLTKANQIGGISAPTCVVFVSVE